MALSDKELLHHCTALLDTFNADEAAVDSHVNAYFEEFSDIEATDRIFITEVFSGCIRFDKVINTVVQGFYNVDGKTILRSDWHLFSVITYLALFRLDELEMGPFHKFVMCIETIKMYRFLKFFLDEKNILTWMKDEWGKHYDSLFVQKELLSPLQTWLPELLEILAKLEDKVNGMTKAKRKTIPPTEVQPFNLTRPRPRSVPMPEEISVVKPTHEIPKSTYKTPREKKILEERRLSNRRQAEEVMLEASKLQPHCANAGKSEKALRRMEAIAMERENELDFERHKSNAVPSFQRDNIPVKLNAAAIMREWKHYNDQEKKKFQKLLEIESGAFDATAFLKWQTETRQADLEAELAEVERRRLEGKISREEAILARQRLVEDNQEVARRMKSDLDKLLAETAEERAMDEEMARRLVEEVFASRAHAKEARKEVKDKKHLIAQEVAQESQQMLNQAMEDAKAELQYKMELIAKIRAMEAAPAVRDKMVDFTSAEGHGLLSEMSIAELRERLAILRSKNEEEREEKRDSILEEKQRRDFKLMQTLEQIGKHRAEKSRKASEQLEQRKVDRQNGSKPPVLPKDERLEELQRQLEERRRMRLEQQQRQRASLGPNNKSAQMVRRLSKEKKTREQNRWTELEASQERAAKLQSQGFMSSQSARRLSGNAPRLPTAS